MELAHLVRAGLNAVPMRAGATAKALARFALLGALWVAADRAIDDARREPVPLDVPVPPGLADADERRRVDEAILLEEAIALGWATGDPIVRARLLDNLRFVRGEGATLRVEDAIRLDMHRRDLVVRRRLVGRMERMLTSEALGARVPDATLVAYRDAHAARYRPPARVRYVGILVARDRHRDDFDAAVREVEQRMREGSLTVEDAARTSDPLLYAPTGRSVSLDEVARALGGELAARLATAPIGRFAGPFSSTFGAHFVFVQAREQVPLPGLDDLRTRLLDDYRAERRDALLRARMDELRARYRVRVVRREGTP